MSRRARQRSEAVAAKRLSLFGTGPDDEVDDAPDDDGDAEEFMPSRYAGEDHEEERVPL